ncbi:MAG: hypothetical protein COT89_01630 [Candidatus Colwellbacteria bacterium CG10_big_fil_rev_8_21_14_0_10_42_22]|uniref:Uncharacterized protein n=1 Tax=Candidatus Colwellbacteria bacterium CG10_big_fil_rev_8_21_14_0_10_42_22 TaxID=1974540 RepID=A0A2H0VFP5_9BACT|nr:MAG: hypothetical protein COT89_01630 [Candidatus Colwellbacteria bacterium CG10_big_fil_rev_8_21_14_0_10_42_22]
MKKIHKWMAWLWFPVLFAFCVLLFLEVRHNMNAGLAAADAGLIEVVQEHFDNIQNYTALMFVDCLIMIVAFGFFLDNITEALRNPKKER